jgi:hypothetical protein
MSEEQKEQDLLAHLQRDVYCQVHARGRELQTQQHLLIYNLLSVGCPLFHGICYTSLCCRQRPLCSFAHTNKQFLLSAGRARAPRGPHTRRPLGFRRFVLCLLCGICCLLNAVHCLLPACRASTVCYLLSAVRCLLSAVRCLLCTVCCKVSAVYCLFRRSSLNAMLCSTSPSCQHSLPALLSC